MVATYLPANLCQGGIFNFFIYSQAKVIGFSVSPLLENNFDNPEKVVSQNHLTYSIQLIDRTDNVAWWLKWGQMALN